MHDTLVIKQLLHASKEFVFQYWTEPEHLQKWARPKSMSLRIPQFEAKSGGKFKYEYMSSEGPYISRGQFNEFIPNQKLTHTETVISPEGKVLFEKLETVVTFQDDLNGTMVTVKQSGIPSESCHYHLQEAWEQIFESLNDLIDSIRFRPGQQLRLHQVRGE